MTTNPGTIHENRQEQHVGALVAQLSDDVSRLVRDEMRLAKAELKDKGKEAGIGIGLFEGVHEDLEALKGHQPERKVTA
ncbi:phage holin family protein [Kribbella catacumbae]|uniref:phage holin family protein n=1 Tax=Kribbella catacumbae TaxID=460086 RepID=UPI00037BCD23|nr:phage holin family protein [Kribbella catacumbae]